MAGDCARVSYDPTRKWTGLVAQQGRVSVDADWNEAATITAERDRLTTLDVVGRFGTPDHGYRVTAVPAGAQAGEEPGDLIIGPGVLYLGGEHISLDAAVTYSAEPDWLDYSTDPVPDPSAQPGAQLGVWTAPAVPDGNRPSHELVYLLATEQEVSAVEDPALADVALGGPDTMQRQRILQHFARRPAQSGNCHDEWVSLVGTLGAQGLEFDAASMTIGSKTSLKVSFTNEVTPPSPCQPVATGGYLGAENQMIKVMVTAVKNGVPTIVWGFDDASFLYRLSTATYDSNSGNTTVTLASAPVDSYHYPALGQAVELLRDAVLLTKTDPVTGTGDHIASATGFVSLLTANYDPAQKQLVISGKPPDDYLSPATPQLYLRVWQAMETAPTGQATELGDTGVAVTLASPDGTFHPGDFWRFALRPIQPAIIYPARYAAEPQPPDGPRTWACPVAVLTWQDGNAKASSCIPEFANLVELTGTGSGCCTVDIRPSDVDGGASLQKLLDRHANKRPVTICLEPGTYTLPRPLIIGPELEGLTLQACREGVVLQASAEPGPEFVLGLIAMQQVASVTIRGLELSVPLVRYSPGADLFDGLPEANAGLLKAFSIDLRVGIGISVTGAAGLSIDGCTFAIPDLAKSNAFCVDIFARGAIDRIGIRGCTFQSADPPRTAPFYDLTTGSGKPEPPYQLTLGYLQVPTLAQASDAGAVGQLLHDAEFQDCLFQGVTVPVLAITQLGTLQVNQNTVRSAYGGFWFLTLTESAYLTLFDRIAIGNPAVFSRLSMMGAAALADRAIAMATAIGRVLPITPPEDGRVIAMPIPQPTAAQLTLARQTFSAFYASVAEPPAAPAQDAAEPEPAEPTPGEPAAAEPPPAEAAAAEPPAAGPQQAEGPAAGLADLPSLLDIMFKPQGAVPPAAEENVPVADTGTSVTLRLDLRDCQVDAVIADSYSGAGLSVVDVALGLGSVLLHGNRIRSRFLLGETAITYGLTEVTVTGNIVANEVTPPQDYKPGAQIPASFSMTLVYDKPLPGGSDLPVAITGNVFIDPTIFPGRPATIPQALSDWDWLNTVIDYTAPPAGG